MDNDNNIFNSTGDFSSQPQQPEQESVYYSEQPAQSQADNSSYQEQPYQEQPYQNYQQSQPYNNGYQQPYNYQPEPQRDEEIGLGEWLLKLLIFSIPCVNIIMLFVWAFDKSERKSLSNFCKAKLIFTAIEFVLVIIIYVVFFAAVMSAAGQYGY